MRTDLCQCGQRLFFDNTQCVRCQSLVGWCDTCRRIASLVPVSDGKYQCQHADCQAESALCHNFTETKVCNWTISEGHGPQYCASCELTEVIPNFSVPEFRGRWFQLESAKRRLLYSLDLLGLPYRRPANVEPPLSFRFLDPSGTNQPVTTGHANGCITISLIEADDVEREKARVAFNEPQRTLLGHFRHEIGHYYWDVLVAGQVEQSFRELFGDERSPTYAEAQKRYYEQGPLPGWEGNFISAYATMHPWEDFAETFNCYLDMFSLLDTAEEHRLIPRRQHDFLKRVITYQRSAIVFNEITRERGLVDLVPEVLTPPVVEKLTFVHQLIQGANDARHMQLSSNTK